KIIAETTKVAGHRRYAARHTLQRGIPPGLVITGKNPKVTSPYKLAVVDAKQRVDRGDEVRVIYDLHFILWTVQQISSMEKGEDFVMFLVDQVVGHRQRKLVAFPGLDRSPVAQLPIFIDKITELGQPVILSRRRAVK